LATSASGCQFRPDICCMGCGAIFGFQDANDGVEIMGIAAITSRITLIALSACAIGTMALADNRGAEVDPTLPPLILGVLDFPNSGPDVAQDAFVRGVMLLHSFEFDDARSAFIEAQKLDPGFAMAIWGEAMTLNHPLWAQQDRNDALKVLARLPSDDELRATDRELRYLGAVRTLYGEGSKAQRDVAYMKAMRGIYEDYPEDLDAAAFYALSILGSVYERDFRTYMKAAAILEEVFAKQPKHPGAAHYLIHCYDDQIHAPLGLRAAREYNRIAPAASHAQHMVSHIYTSLGQWDEVVAANRNAVRVSEDSMRRNGKSIANRSKHSLHWLQYALLQQGRFDLARESMLLMREDLTEIPNLMHERHSALMRASYIADDPEGEDILDPVGESDIPLDDRSIDTFASGYRYVALDDLERARQELEVLQTMISEARVLSVEEGLHEDDSATSEDDYLIATIVARELQSLIMFREGDTEGALKLLADAATDENSRPLYYGPPHIPKPCSELLGEMLLALDRPGEAIPHFEIALERNTSRTLALLGLARAQEAAGEPAAVGTWHKVQANWRAKETWPQTIEYSWLR